MGDHEKKDLYDLGYLEELSGGSKEFVDGITETFLKNIPEQMEQMMNAYKAHDLKAMGENAHRMKPSLDLFRIRSLHDTIRFIEAKGKNEMSDPQLETALKEVDETVCQVILSMSKK